MSLSTAGPRDGIEPSSSCIQPLGRATRGPDAECKDLRAFAFRGCFDWGLSRECVSGVSEGSMCRAGLSSFLPCGFPKSLMLANRQAILIPNQNSFSLRSGNDKRVYGFESSHRSKDRLPYFRSKPRGLFARDRRRSAFSDDDKGPSKNRNLQGALGCFDGFTESYARNRVTDAIRFE